MVKSNYMEFELTPEITNDIIFAMEDQSGHFLYDSEGCLCVPANEADEAWGGELSDSNDDQRFYEIPLWDSVSGFRMMDRFVAQLRNPVVREELRDALSSGHGVFRSFKNILKAWPEIERQWFLFKDRYMHAVVLEWYNGLRDSWGLERIGPEPEETEDIVSQDFSFLELQADDAGSADVLLASFAREIATEYPVELADALMHLWQRIRGTDDGSERILAAETADGEIVGVSISSPFPEGSFLTAQLSIILVFPEYRGMGIGKELLERTVQLWAGKGYRWLVCASPLVPVTFAPVLQRAGFQEKGHVSVLDLTADSM